MSADRTQLLYDLRVAFETNDLASIVRLQGVLRKGVAVDPLAPCFDSSTAQIIADYCKPAMLVWHVIPEKHRKATGQAMLDGAQAVRKQMNADKEVCSTVMHLAVNMLAEEDLPRCITLFKMVTDDGPTADVGRRKVAQTLAHLDRAMASKFADCAVLVEARPTGTGRFSLLQIALMATINAKGPRSDDVQDLVQQMTEIHGDRARHQLSPRVMNPLIWTAEIENERDLQNERHAMA